MRKCTGAAIGVLAIFLGLVSVGSVAAQETSPTGEQMAQMMEAMHGPGTVERMRESLGADADSMMEQCAAMMRMMAAMGGMMSPSSAPAPAEPSSGPSMQEMMYPMMGR